MKNSSVDDYVRRVVAEAPPLSREQIAVLTKALSPTPTEPMARADDGLSALRMVMRGKK